MENDPATDNCGLRKYKLEVDWVMSPRHRSHAYLFVTPFSWPSSAPAHSPGNGQMPIRSHASDCASENGGNDNDEPVQNVGVRKEELDEGIHLVLAEEVVDDQLQQGRLFLGTQRAAQQADLLHRNGISRVVCVGTPPFHPEEFDYLEVPVLDMPSENMLVHLDKCVSFVEAGMRERQGVLVNCVFAQSRSVTVVVAYLMKQKGLALDEAVVMTRAAQPTGHINPGFQAQLALYHDMGCRLNATDGPPTVLTAQATYRWFLFANSANSRGVHVPADNRLSHTILDGNMGISSARENRIAVEVDATRTSYRCKACRTSLFYKDNVIDHRHPLVLATSETAYEAIARYGDGSSWLAARDAAVTASTLAQANPKGTGRKAKGCHVLNGGRVSQKQGQQTTDSPATTGCCTSVFTEVLSWIGLSGVNGDLARGESMGRISCPGRSAVACGSKLGAWSLQGTSCSCGQTVKPSVQFKLSRIEIAQGAGSASSI